MEHSEGSPEESSRAVSGERSLEVLFEVRIPADCSCLLSNPETKVENVHNQLCGGVCHAEVTVEGDDGTDRVVHARNRVGDDCLCLAFTDVGCVPRIKSAEGDVLLVETYLEDRSVIGDLVDRLNAVAEHVSLRRLTSRDVTGSLDSNPTTIDLSQLTSKQREAAMLAVSEGYYESPRQTTLDELSETLGISKSALSQRLNIVESKLATAAFDP